MTFGQIKAFEKLVEDYLAHCMDEDSASMLIWKYSEEQFLKEAGCELAKFNMTALEAMSCIGTAFYKYKRRSQ